MAAGPDNRRPPGFIEILRAAGGPPRARWETRAMLVVALIAASLSTAAFFLHVSGLLQMPFFVNFFFMPATVLMMIVGLYSWQRRLPFWVRFRAGLLAGTLGVIAYDTIRYSIYKSGLLDYFPFHAIAKLGGLITGLGPEAPSSLYAGWTYHFWNAYSYAIIYALVVGPAKWYWAVGWAMILEAGMLLSYPTFLDVKFDAPFLAISLIGHFCYGTVLGLTVRKWGGSVAGPIPAARSA
jgi:hypothetical protein